MSDDENTDTTYKTFKACTSPSPLPILSTDATQYQITATKDQHKRKVRLFKEQFFVERSLRNKVINTFDETYLLDIKKKYIKCNNGSMHSTFKHLCRRCGNVTDDDFLANKETMIKHWDPVTPIEPICKQVEDGAKFSK